MKRTTREREKKPAAGLKAGHSRRTFVLPDVLHRALAIRAAEDGESMSAIVIRALERELKETGR